MPGQGQMNEADLKKMIKMMMEEYSQQGAGAGGGGGGVAAPAAAGGGAGYALSGGGSGLAADAGANAAWNAAADAATAEAGAAGAGAEGLASYGSFAGPGAEAVASGAPEGLLTGASPLTQVAVPLAFMGGMKLAAPSIMKGGQKIGKLMGIGGGKPDRPYVRKEYEDSKLFGNNLPGKSAAEKGDIADRLHKLNLLTSPGGVDEVAAGGLEVAPKIAYNRMIGWGPNSDGIKENLQRKYGNYWQNRAPLDEVMGMIPQASLKKNFRDELNSIIGGGGQPPAAQAPSGQANNLMYIPKTPQEQEAFNMDDIGDIFNSKIIRNPKTEPFMIPRSKTSSPGMDKNGRRINY